jgi:hypothetical protein
MTMKTIVKSMKEYSPDNEDYSKTIKTKVMTIKTMKDYSHDYEDCSKDYERL